MRNSQAISAVACSHQYESGTLRYGITLLGSRVQLGLGKHKVCRPGWRLGLSMLNLSLYFRILTHGTLKLALIEAVLHIRLRSF